MKILKTLIVITFTVMLFAMGIYAGIRIQYQEDLNNQARDYSIQSTIAVVNLDVGVQQEDKSVKNYSTAIIDGLGSNYVLVSSSMAESGYNSGKYGAVLIFPTELSKAVESVNTDSPYQIEIDFKVNSNLPQEKYIQVYTELLTLQSDINSAITFMYVDSILEEFHKAQNEAKALMENNNELLSEAEKLNLGNYTSFIEMAEIPRKEFEPKPIEIVNFVNRASEYANSISELYLSSYAVAQKDFDKVEEEMGKAAEKLDTTTKEWIDKVQLWTTQVDHYNESVKIYVAGVDGFRQSLDIWAEKLNNWENQTNLFADEFREYEKSVENWLSRINDYKNELENFCQTANEFYSEEMLRQNVDTWNDWKKEVNDIYTIVVDNSELYNAFGTEAVKVVEQYHKMEPVIEEWELYSEAVTEWKEELESYRSGLVIDDETYKQYMDALDEYKVTLRAYNDFFKLYEKEINEKIAEINEAAAESGGETDDADKVVIEQFELSEELQEKQNELAVKLSDTEKLLTEEQEEFEKWVSGYKDLTDELPEINSKVLKPEAVEQIDSADLMKAEKNLSNVKEYKELDMTVPEDIELVMFDESVLVMDDMLMPEYTLKLPEGVKEGKPIFDGQEPEYNISDFPSRPNDLLSNLEALGRLAASYNPKEYLTDEVTGRIAGVIGQYESYLGGVEQSIQSNQQSNLNVLMKNYSEYSVYLSELKAQVRQLHKEEQDKLQSGLNVFAVNAKEIGNESKNYINDFAGKLPYTRNNSVTNKLFIETVVTPLRFNNGNVVIQQSNVQQSENGELIIQIVLVLFSMIIIMTIGLLIPLIVIKRKNTEQINV